MSPSDPRAQAPVWPDSLRLLLHLGALLLLSPLYWQMKAPAAALLLLLVQALLVFGCVQEWRQSRTYRYRMKAEDWVPAACGGFILELGNRLHGKGCDPEVSVLAASETCRQLVDQQGNIHVFSERPLSGLIEVCRRGTLRRMAAAR